MNISYIKIQNMCRIVWLGLGWNIIKTVCFKYAYWDVFTTKIIDKEHFIKYNE